MIPYSRFSIESEIPVDEVVRRLELVTRVNRQSSRERDEEAGGESSEFLFEGRFNENRFTIYRERDKNGFRYFTIQGDPRGFLPAIHGTVDESPNGSTLRVTVSLRPTALTFLALAVCIALSFSFGTGKNVPAPGVAFGMAIFVYVLNQANFVIEARWAKNVLRTLFATAARDQ